MFALKRRIWILHTAPTIRFLGVQRERALSVRRCNRYLNDFFLVLDIKQGSVAPHTGGQQISQGY
jgi:hypothetical protein